MKRNLESKKIKLEDEYDVGNRNNNNRNIGPSGSTVRNGNAALISQAYASRHK